MKVPAGSRFYFRLELASPPPLWDPKTGRKAPPIYCGFSKAPETAQVEAFSCAVDVDGTATFECAPCHDCCKNASLDHDLDAMRDWRHCDRPNDLSRRRSSSCHERVLGFLSGVDRFRRAHSFDGRGRMAWLFAALAASSFFHDHVIDCPCHHGHMLSRNADVAVPIELSCSKTPLHELWPSHGIFLATAFVPNLACRFGVQFGDPKAFEVESSSIGLLDR